MLLNISTIIYVRWWDKDRDWETNPIEMWEIEIGEWWQEIIEILPCNTIITPYGSVDVDGLSVSCYFAATGFCKPGCY